MVAQFSMNLEDHVRVSDAVHTAEHSTSGEIVTIVADHSDRYLDIALWWSVAAAVFALAVVAVFPEVHVWFASLFGGGWADAPTSHETLTFALGIVVSTFVIVRLILHWIPARIFMTPGVVKSARVRRRAIRYFKVGAERRTAGKTGILIYLSLIERRAEIVADEAIHGKIPQERWATSMSLLLEQVKQGDIAGGICAAVADVGQILAENFPRSADDVNELPDRLIEI